MCRSLVLNEDGSAMTIFPKYSLGIICSCSLLAGLALTLPANATSTQLAAPSDLVASPSIGSLYLTWSAVHSTGQSPVTYKVTSTPPGKSCISSSTSCWIAVADTTPWVFTVKAIIGNSHSPSSAPTTPVPTKVVLVVAGQSNAEGINDPTTPVNYLAAPYANRADDVDQMTWWWGSSDQVSLGSIDNPQEFSASSETLTAMGPEIGLARGLMADRGESVDIVKDAVPGSFLGSPAVWPSWDPSYRGSLLPGLINGVDSTLAQLANEGSLGILGGFYWYQGESDAWFSHFAHTYKVHLTTFIKTIRAELPSASKMPVILVKEDITQSIDESVSSGSNSVKEGRIALVGNGLVRGADDAVAASLPKVIDVDTVEFARGPDYLHLTPASEIALGYSLAAASESLVP